MLKRNAFIYIIVFITLSIRLYGQKIPKSGLRAFKELKLNIPDSFVVPAINAHYSTNIMLQKGKVYKFEVKPQTQTWEDGKILKPFTAKGRRLPHLALLYLFIRMPSVKWFALLGNINDKGKSNFKIGSDLPQYIPQNDGILFCFANDALGFNDYFYRHNNEGEIKVFITLIKE